MRVHAPAGGEAGEVPAGHPGPPRRWRGEGRAPALPYTEQRGQRLSRAQGGRGGLGDGLARRGLGVPACRGEEP
eukprot:14421508-Alexandrium_andersonii.AAC.1